MTQAIMSALLAQLEAGGFPCRPLDSHVAEGETIAGLIDAGAVVTEAGWEVEGHTVYSVRQVVSDAGAGFDTDCRDWMVEIPGAGLVVVPQQSYGAAV